MTVSIQINKTGRARDHKRKNKAHKVLWGFYINRDF
jgi:hypothetical protein